MPTPDALSRDLSSLRRDLSARHCSTWTSRSVASLAPQEAMTGAISRSKHSDRESRGERLSARQGVTHV